MTKTKTVSKIAIIYHSIYGHTKLQAEAAFRGAQSVPSISAQLYTAEEAAARLDELDDAGTADLFMQISRGIAQWLRLIEGIARAERGQRRQATLE